MFDFDALCPHCEGKFKLSRIGLETKSLYNVLFAGESSSSTSLIQKKKAIRLDPDFAG